MERLAITEADALKALKKANRELELDLHGKQVSFRPHVETSAKRYNRQKAKKVEY